MPELRPLVEAMSSRNPFVRQIARRCLGVPRVIAGWQSTDDEFVERPPVLANSFPKSGTHLLAQIVAALPASRNYGTFLSSMTSSYQFRERTPRNTAAFIESFVPGELVRGHLFFSRDYETQLNRRRAIQYFIYRDLRDVVVSEAHYLRSMNRWHRLHPYFRHVGTLEDAISLSICGLPDDSPVEYPNVAARFRRFQGWLRSNSVLPIRFEQLTTPGRECAVREIVKWYASQVCFPVDVDCITRRALSAMNPLRSHTFRAGGGAGAWQKSFTNRHRAEMEEVAGELLDELGYGAGASTDSFDEERPAAPELPTQPQRIGEAQCD